ncbi:MAG: hypothetical protein AVDCRST_MAG59-4456, partial [uncultured Thermomicrobiales bacterium]
ERSEGRPRGRGRTARAANGGRCRGDGRGLALHRGRLGRRRQAPRRAGRPPAPGPAGRPRRGPRRRPRRRR